jgi:hypothetical protein
MAYFTQITSITIPNWGWLLLISLIGGGIGEFVGN